MAAERLSSIQALRAVAALMVTGAHAANYASDASARAGTTVDVGWTVIGAAGVDLFFVISGFIMVYTTRGAWGSPQAAGQFFARRLLRIVPLYWLATLLLLAYLSWLGMTWEQNAIDWPTIAGSFLFFFHARTNGSVEPILGQGWSLNYEMVFYAWFAVAMLVPWRRPAIVGLLAAMVFIGGWRHLLPFDLPLALAYPLNSLLWEFAMGAALALAIEAGLRLPRWACAVLMVAGVLLLVQTSTGTPWHPDRALHWGLPCALIVAGAVLHPWGERVKASRPWRGLCYLGDASYALYLFHGLVMMIPRPHMQQLTAAVLAVTGAWGFALMLVAISIAVAAAVYLLVERPTTEALKAWLRQDRRRLVAVPAE